MATIEAEAKEKTRAPRRTSEPSPSINRNCFSLHVTILQLHSTSPTLTHPKLISAVSVEMGYSVKDLVSTFPFAFTWTPDHLYTTKSDSSLRVYKIKLSSSNCGTASGKTVPWNKAKMELAVTVPKETIFLPRYARDRKVQFFPGALPGEPSKVVISPRYGVNPEPTIAVLLEDSHLGGWVSQGELHGGPESIPLTQQRLEGNFEDFDTSDDCDIIPVDRYLP